MVVEIPYEEKHKNLLSKRQTKKLTKRFNSPKEFGLERHNTKLYKYILIVQTNISITIKKLIELTGLNRNTANFWLRKLSNDGFIDEKIISMKRKNRKNAAYCKEYTINQKGINFIKEMDKSNKLKK